MANISQVAGCPASRPLYRAMSSVAHLSLVAQKLVLINCIKFCTLVYPLPFFHTQFNFKNGGKYYFLYYKNTFRLIAYITLADLPNKKPYF
jgi:hypothetical protein